MTANETDKLYYLRMNTNGTMEIRDMDPDRDLLDLIHQELDGGFMEIVRPAGLTTRYLMLVDDCGLLKNLDINVNASIIYGCQRHGQMIAGTALIMIETIDYETGERDIAGMPDYLMHQLIKELERNIVITRGV